MAMDWSPIQQQTIDSRSQDILVSAAAGSGKTAVLVERITRLVLDPEAPVPVTAMLVVTFTTAAAAEMRSRIEHSLREALRTFAETGSKGSTREAFLRRQLADLHRANISNFHSFASSLLREFFYVVGVDPGFQIADEVQAHLLKEEAMDLLFEEAFRQTGAQKEAFLSYLRLYGDPRSEEPVREQIRQIAVFLESSPNAEVWFSDAESYGADPLDHWRQSELYHAMMEGIFAQLNTAKQYALEAVSLVQTICPHLYEKEILSDLQTIEDVQTAFTHSFEEGRKQLDAIAWATFGRVTKAQMQQWPDECQAYAAEKEYLAETLRKGYKSIFSGDRSPLKAFTSLPLEDAYRKMNETRPALLTLLSLVKRYLELYRQRKDERHLLDFSDLEQYALRVLKDDAVRETLQKRFRYIFVDEYQDSNRVQETLVNALYAPGQNNLFFVGDVKQSIYRFRQAEPDIFIERSVRYKTAMDSGDPSTLQLDFNQNFRSEGPILNSVNCLFRGLIEPTVSHMAYDDAAALYPGKPEAAGAKTPVELHLVDRRSDEENQWSAVEAEAEVAAQLAEQQLGQRYCSVKDGKEHIVEPRDIVLLFRNRTHMNVFEKALLRHGIPAYTADDAGFLETTEVTVFSALLKVIDNRRQDEALLAALHSPVFRFSLDDLAAIRSAHQTGSFADAFFACVQGHTACGEPSLQQRARNVLDRLAAYRQQAKFSPLSDFLWDLMLDTGYYHYAGALPNGTVRQANLRLLLTKASSFEAQGGSGLSAWIRFLDSMKLNRIKMPQSKTVTAEDNVVRLMTMHSSKGLEFPVCIVAQLGARMDGNSRDDDLLLHTSGAVALPHVNSEQHLKTPTLLHTVLKQLKQREERAEHLRTLYVAMTRPMHKLILLGTPTAGGLSLYESGRGFIEGNVLGASSYLDWLLGSAAFLDSCAVKEIHGVDQLTDDANQEFWEQSALEKAYQTGFDCPADPAFADELNRRFGWRYPYAEDTGLLSKVTVSQLNRPVFDEDQTVLPYLPPFSVPAFARRGQATVFTGAQRGTVLHRLMEHVDFRTDWSLRELQQLVASMVEQEFFTAEEAATLPLEKVLRFFASDLGQRACRAAAGGKLFREVNFSLQVPVNGQLQLAETGTPVLVQGTIDCYFTEAQADGTEQVILLDYKTNYLDEQEDRAEEALLEAYSTQLKLYRLALERIQKRTVAESYLYAFSVDKALLFKA